MILLVDIGNTGSKFAQADATQVQHTGSVEHLDMSLVTLRQLFSKTPSPDSVWVSCVGPDHIYATIEQWASQQFGLSVNRVVVSDKACGVVNGYQEQAKLGVDRWVAAIGAREKIKAGDLLIIDVGTAINIEWLDLHNVYQGGVIIPGYGLMHESLTANTQGVASYAEPTEQVIGKTTEQCVNAGISYGLVGAVERIIAEMTKLISSPVTLVLTGGGAQLLINRSNLDYSHEPQLLMFGLLRLAREKK